MSKEEISSATDLIQAVTKTSNALKMYMSNNPLLQRFLEEVKEKSKFVEQERNKEYFGLIGKKILGKERLREEGWLVWDLEDIEKAYARTR